MEGAVNVQVGVNSRQERWVASANRERDMTMNGCLWWGAVGWRGKNNDIENDRIMWVGRA